VAATAGTPIAITVTVPGTDRKMTILINITVVDGEVMVVPGTAAPAQ
jgi:hypothetical protein